MSSNYYFNPYTGILIASDVVVPTLTSENLSLTGTLDFSYNSTNTFTIGVNNEGLYISNTTSQNIVTISASSNQVTIPNLIVTTFNIESNIDQIAGTSGSLSISMVFSGTSYKKLSIFANNYVNSNTVTYTFPVPFVNQPITTANTSGLIGLYNTTSITINPTSKSLNGFVFIEGY